MIDGCTSLQGTAAIIIRIPYPDITMLSTLAYYFRVTIDELMGYDESRINQEIEDLLVRYPKVNLPMVSMK